MTAHWKEVVTLRFKGERFRDHALDLSAVSELRQFQKIVAETARARWKAAHPDRDRLPAHFDQLTRLCLRRIEEGSAALPLEVYVQEPQQRQLWEVEPEEVQSAVELAYQSFRAIDSDQALPDALPKELVAEYAEFGRVLAEDEEVEVQPSDRRPPARVNAMTRERWTKFQTAPHSTPDQLIGECLEADVRNRRFQLWLDPGTCVQVTFGEAQEDLVTSALKDHRSIRIKVRGQLQVLPQGKPVRFTAVESIDLVETGPTFFDQTAAAIEDELAAIWADVPASEWHKLPNDLTDNLDHYIYEAPQE